MKFLLPLLLLLSSNLIQAQGIVRTQEAVTVTEEVLFVTHTSRIFTEDTSLKAGVDRQVQAFKAAKLPVVYLLNDDEDADENWMTADRRPTFGIASRNGDHDVNIQTSKATITGGFLSLCFDRTVDAVVESARANRIKLLSLTFPLDSIYEDKSLFMAEMNLSFQEMELFFGIKNHHTLRHYKDVFSKKRFLHGLRSYFALKKALSYEVVLDGKIVFKHRTSRQPRVRFILK